MRKLLIIAFVFAIVGWANANPIKFEKAQRKATTFVSKQLRTSQPNLRKVYAPGETRQEAPLYVFNVGKKQGFVIVAADGENEDIVGYSDEGEFDYNNLPENLKAWIDGMTLTAQAMGSAHSSKTTNHPTDVIQPLITTKWGQRVPYNSSCPVVDGEHCPTGCTATALAQVMRFHQYPTDKTVTIPKYTTQTLKIAMPALPSTTLEWDKMPDELTGDSPQECIDAVAKLMLYCGQATDMNYTASGSGAYSYKIPERLPMYFKYPSTMHYVYRYSYDEQGWDSLLVSELLKRQPIIYTAYTNLAQGHTFICDGYDGNGLYHINWGWNGVGNGYYRISVAFATEEGLNDNIKNYHLSVNQTALIGLKTAGEDDYVLPAETFVAFTRPSLKDGKTYTRETTAEGFTFTMKQSFVNSAEELKKLSHGLGLYDDTGTLVTVLTSSTASLSAGSKKDYEASKVLFGGNLNSGHYTLKAVYKPTSTAEWRPMGGTDRNYVDVVIDNLNATLMPMPKANFVVSAVKKQDDYMLFDFYNYDEDFYGPVYLRKLNADQTISQVCYDFMSVDANTRRIFELYIDESKIFDIDNDTYYLSVDEYDTQYFYCNKTDEDILSIDKQIEVLNLNEDSTTIVGDRVISRLKLTNNGTETVTAPLTIALVDVMGHVVDFVDWSTTLKAGKDTTTCVEFLISNYDNQYQVVVGIKKDQHMLDETATNLYEVEQGVFYWKKDGGVKTMQAERNFEVPEEAVAISLRGVNISSVVPNSNPNTIYMLEKTMLKGLSGKNWVNSTNKAATLSLYDGYDYFIPTEMGFASTVSYSMVAADSDKTTWSTICLPFAPTKVTANGTEVKWMTSEDDSEGKFRIMSIESIVGDSTKLAYVNQMEANKTYLIATDSLVAGATLVFSCTKKTFSPTWQQNYQTVVDDQYSFMGAYCGQTIDSCYVMEDNTLVFKAQGAEVMPFKAAFVKKGTIDVETIYIEEEEKQPELQLGDINGDGAIDVTDVMLVVAVVLGDTDDEIFISRSDINGDNAVDVTDVMCVVDIILTSN